MVEMTIVVNSTGINGHDILESINTMATVWVVVWIICIIVMFRTEIIDWIRMVIK